MTSNPLNPHDQFYVTVRMVQGHRGKLMQINYRISREMVVEEPDGMLAAITSQMDRQMLEAIGHVDEHRLWFTDEYAYSMWLDNRPARTMNVYLLDGPNAGESHLMGVAPMVRVPLVGGGVAGYETHRIGHVWVGVFQQTESWFT